MGKSNYLVSAIVSTYKSERFIKGKIEDLLRQTLADKVEIIIINSGSPQGEDAIVRSFLDKGIKNIKYIKTEERETIYKAWNRGIEAATGKYVTNANTDDRLRIDAYEVLAKALDENPHIGLVYGDQIISEVENATYEETPHKTVMKRPIYNRLLFLNGYMAGSQSMWRAELHKEQKMMFDEKYEIVGDYDFLLRVSEMYDLMLVPQVLGVYYKSPNNSNKELQNLDATIKEATEVKFKYLDRLIEGLSSKDRTLISKNIDTLLIIPRVLHALTIRIQKALSPRRTPIDREFFVIMAAKIAVSDNNKKKALKYLRMYKNRKNAVYTRTYIEELKAKGFITNDEI